MATTKVREDGPLVCSECRQVFTRNDRRLAHCCSDVCRQARDNRLQADRLRNEPTYRARRLRQKLAANATYNSCNRAKVAHYYQQKRRNDPVFKMACWSRSILQKVLKRTNRRKDATCVTILGYDGQTLKMHIERQFTKGMAWPNYGEWHIDHVVPVAEFLRQGLIDPAIINALSNLRPMWARDNILKSDKVDVLL